MAAIASRRLSAPASTSTRHSLQRDRPSRTTRSSLTSSQPTSTGGTSPSSSKPILSSLSLRHLAKMAKCPSDTLRARPARQKTLPRPRRSRSPRRKASARARSSAHSRRPMDGSQSRSRPTPASPEPRQKETYRAPLRRKPKLETHTGIEVFRDCYVAKAAELGVDIEVEIEAVTKALREHAGGAKRHPLPPHQTDKGFEENGAYK